MTSTSPRHPRRTRKAFAALAATCIAFAVLTGTAAPATAEEPAEAGQEQFRPQFHFSPEKNWMNDPNGMVYVDGVYHLYYQHNPEGTRWGNMSWGHATSTDLMHWEEQPLALPQTFDESGVAIEDIFSGSIVVDETNSSGFGTGDKPPLVAIYTSAYTQDHPTHPGIQAQSLAYSNDGGYTWTKHEGNPVYDRGSANFRDPKVFWYDGPAGAYWVMAAVEAVDHKVILAKSTDLRSWEHLSEFGPANSTEGIWECPELFELPVDGNPDETKWVMVVNLNPGAVAGGSGGQYFVGDFDGVEFTSESTVEPGTTAEGAPFATFDGGDFGGWTVTNEAGNEADGPWGLAPATGTLPGQGPVKGTIGAGFVNGFHGGDWPVGSLESPQFTIESDFINLLVGGGNHPHVEGSQIGNEPPAGTTVFDFELADGENLLGSGWEATGDFALDPARSPSKTSGEYALGDKRINTWEGGPLGDDNTGTITSPSFTLDGDFASFLIGGGNRNDGTLQVELLVDGSVVRTQTGANAGQMTWQSWDISEFAGKDAQLRVRDEATGGWGHLTFDHLVIGDEPSQLRSEETAVNLIVDGEVVRTATGRNSETLDWSSWDVSDLRGQQATIQAVDQNRSGWGHLLLDQIMFADTSVPSALESYDWLDWGRDYYATVSYFGTPEGSRIMQGWMNNWDYANDIPTSTWRSSMTLPREVVLTSTPAGPRLKQQVVPQVDEQLDVAGAATRTDVALDGAVDLGLSGDVVKLDVTLEPGEAQRAGITVFGDAESGTRIGYDAAKGRLFVDRTNSGDVDFHPAFASVEDAPVALDDDGSVTFSLYLDRASVELFTADGMVTITDQVFPNEGADAITAWSEGGAATLRSITVTPVTPTMWQEPGAVVAPSAPLDPIAVVDDAAVTLSWSAPAQDGGAEVTEYRVYSDARDEVVGTSSGLTTTLPGLTPGSTERFAVSAVNSAGEGPRSEWSNAVTAPSTPSTTPQPTGEPTPTATLAPTASASPSPTSTSTSTPPGGSETGTPTPEGLASTGADFPLAAVLFGLALVGGGAVLGARRLGRRGQ